MTYYHIYECPDFTVGIFCIPEGRDIPTHDHPGMTVCSKVRTLFSVEPPAQLRQFVLRDIIICQIQVTRHVLQ